MGLTLRVKEFVGAHLLYIRSSCGPQGFSFIPISVLGRLEVAFLGTSPWAIAECKRRQEGRDRYDSEPLLDSYGIFIQPRHSSWS
jgi:hypothetical protein